VEKTVAIVPTATATMSRAIILVFILRSV
jgi:hypothetical protein